MDDLLSQLTGSHRPFDEVLRRIENGVFTVLDLAAGDHARVRDLCTQYGDWPLGFVDAAVITLAERERRARIAALDRRHLAAFKPQHIAVFELLPYLTSPPGRGKPSRSRRSRTQVVASLR